MISHHNEIFVVDWGLALRLDGDEITSVSPGGIGGTPAYMAPEQARYKLADILPTTDIYLLGGLLFHILYRQPPHQGSNARECLEHAASNIIAEPYNRPFPALHDLAMFAMQGSHTERPQTVRDFLNELKRIERSLHAERLLQQAIELTADKTHENFHHATALCNQAEALHPNHTRTELIRSRVLNSHADWALQRGNYNFTGRF